MKWLLRKFPVIAALLAFAAVFVWLDLDKQFRRDNFKAFSLHNTSADGCSLAYRFLSQSSSKTEVRELNRLVELAPLERDAVIFRMGPQTVPGEHAERERANLDKKENQKLKALKIASEPRELLTPGEKKWVESGGRLVLALEGNYGPLELRLSERSAALRSVFPRWPELANLQASGSRVLSGKALETAHTLFALGDEVYAARLALGDGEVLLFAGADIFSNGHLAEDGHLQLLKALAGGRPVYFDEYVHNLQSAPGLFELLNGWGLGMALLCGGLLALCAVWRARMPIGPPEDPYRDERSEAVDFVAALAPLYGKALSREQALAAHYKHFLRSAAVQSGLRGPALAAKIRTLFAGVAHFSSADEQALSGQMALNQSEFERLLRALNEAYGRLELAHGR